MKISTLRSIAELNLQPLFRISKYGVAATICAIIGYANMTTSLWLPFFGAAALLADRHIRWDSSRHNKNNHNEN